MPAAPARASAAARVHGGQHTDCIPPMNASCSADKCLTGYLVACMDSWRAIFIRGLPYGDSPVIVRVARIVDTMRA